VQPIRCDLFVILRPGYRHYGLCFYCFKVFMTAFFSAIEMFRSANRLRPSIFQSIEHIFQPSRVTSSASEKQCSCPLSRYHHTISCFSSCANRGSASFRPVNSSLLACRGLASLTKSKCVPSDLTNVYSFHTSAPDGEKGGGKQAKKGIAAQFKAMFKDYWYVLVPVHCATSVVWYGGFYVMCKSGIDMVGVLETLGTSEKILNPLRNSDAGYYALAYACYKIATPFRYTVTVGGTGYTINYLQKNGILTAKDVKESAIDKASDLKERANDAKETAMEKASDLKENYEEAMEKFDHNREKAKERLSKFRNKLSIKYKNK